MPTIDELAPAQSVSDSDEVVVSQAGIARRATRAQVLAGVQAGLAVPQASLLGRVSSGVGGPEFIRLGSNISIDGFILNAPDPFVVSSLGTAGQMQAADQVPVGQGGRNAATSYSAFMSGIANLPGIDASDFRVISAVGVAPRSLGAIVSDALAVEAFGAVGDGVTDDSAAFQAAFASGIAAKLGAKTYIVNSAVVAAAPFILLGVQGASIIRRLQATRAGDWISVTSPSFVVDGVTFDAGNLATSDGAAVFVGPTCTESVFSFCRFMNSHGPGGGCGILISSASGGMHSLKQCRAQSNGLYGVALAGQGSLLITDCTCNNNAQAGISVSGIWSGKITGNVCSMNGTGISFGDTSAGAPQQGNGTSILIADNTCGGNQGFGISAAGTAVSICGNVAAQNGSLTSGGGILARLGLSLISGNITESGAYGLDCRSCWSTSVTNNHISGAAAGISAGGCVHVQICDNFLVSNSWGATVNAFEPSVTNAPTGAVSFVQNWIGYTTVDGGGISVLDGATGIAVIRNDINGWGAADVSRSLWLHTDAAAVEGNRWNNAGRTTVSSSVVAGLATLVVPDVADEAIIVAAGAGIQSILSSHQVDTLGQVTFLRASAVGSGYTTATVVISGTGTGASASTVIVDGQVIGYIMTNAGSGYGYTGGSATAVVSGDGTGATATIFVGTPLVEGRRLRLACNCQVRLILAGAQPPQSSWTGFDSTIPAYGAVELEATYGQWRAVQFPAVDYVAPTGDGGAVLQSVSGGNLVLRAGSGGRLSVSSATEPAGYTTNVGRGSPEGAVSASPGSDFRNLDGGAGNTLWVKQTGNDGEGWVAVA